MRALSSLVLAVVAALCCAAPAAAAPAPCDGTPQITDAAGDGHHPNTDVTAAWLSEQAGRLQAVIQVQQTAWEPVHDDSNAAVFALVFEAGGHLRYVRAEAPRGAQVRYDHGSWSRSGGFVSAGSTAGEITSGGRGTVTIDVPGIGAGTQLRRPFVLTHDGFDGAEPHWVDRAPGGTTPDGTEVGADYVAGSCASPAGGGGTGPDGTAGEPAGSGAGGLTGVVLSAPSRLVGGGTALVRGSVVPARGGVPVDLTMTTTRDRFRRVTTAADGTYSVRVPIRETTRIRAEAGGIGSQTRTIEVRPSVRISVQRRAGGIVVVRGTVGPALPGRLLLVRTTSPTPVARKTLRTGRSFTFRLRRPRSGRHQVVFIPAGGRALRVTSNTGVIR